MLGQTRVLEWCLVGILLATAACTGSQSAPVTVRPDQTTTTTMTVATATTAPGASQAPRERTHGLPPTGSGSPIANGPRNTPAVALTFDSNLTDYMIHELDTGRVANFDNTAVIDELDQYQVPASFFLAGRWMERYPDTVRRLATDPLFELGSHSYAHLGFTDHCYRLGKIAVSDMAADVQHSEDLLRSFTADATNLFRFPGGCYDPIALAAIAPTGVAVIQYDLPSGDAFGKNADTIVNNVLQHCRNGSIVVLHITGGNTAPLTADALPRIIEGLRDKGFSLETVTHLLTRPPG